MGFGRAGRNCSRPVHDVAPQLDVLIQPLSNRLCIVLVPRPPVCQIHAGVVAKELNRLVLGRVMQALYLIVEFRFNEGRD